jgi:hypothetical protein
MRTWIWAAALMGALALSTPSHAFTARGACWVASKLGWSSELANSLCWIEIEMNGGMFNWETEEWEG